MTHQPPLPVSTAATLYDPAAMSSTRLVVVGTGGAAGFVQDIARCGVGSVVLVDPDVVEPANLLTQHVLAADIGALKVDALASRLGAIAPGLPVTALPLRDDALDDERWWSLLHAPLNGTSPPALTILCAFTDDFTAQARTALRSLRHGTALLSAGVYQDGVGAELVVVLPGVTPACARCVQRRRYAAHTEGQRAHHAPSRLPLYATARLNALKILATLALAHAGSPVADPTHPGTIRYRRTMAAVARRNLAVIRCDPSLTEVTDLTAFEHLDRASGGRTQVDDTVWLAQTPDVGDQDHPACPDCAGRGDLRTAPPASPTVTPTHTPTATGSPP